MARNRQPRERTLDTRLLGRRVTLDYSETWLAYSIFGLRVVMGWVFLQSGLEKWAFEGWGDPLAWSSATFLERAVAEANPFHWLFSEFAGYAGIFDPLVIFGQVLIGLALLFGAFLRFAALMGGIMMLFFWIAAWQGGLRQGFPVDHGFLVDSTFVYLLLLFGLAAWGAGRVAGIDRRLEDTSVVQNNPWLKYFLG